MDIKSILKMVDQRQNNDHYAYFKYGHDYYVSRNTAIMERKKQVLYYDDKKPEQGTVDVNPFAANHKVPSGHFKKLVLQKVLYALGNGVLWNDSKQSEKLDAFFPDMTFDEFVIKAGIEASKYGEAWAYAYMDNGKLVFALADGSQLTPIYNEYGKLTAMVKSFKEGDKNVIHLFTAEGIDRYEAGRNGNFMLKAHFGHYAEYEVFNGVKSDNPVQKNFASIPFIPLFNNDERLSDLFPIKPLIDVYDIIHSDFANNIDDMQDIYMTVKGMTGEALELSRFIKQLKTIKAIPVSDEGDVQTHQAEVPVQARETYLKRLENDIYNFAMGVNLKNIEGGSITNVYIKAQMSDLDLKCDQFESEMRQFINKVLAFLNVNANAQLVNEYSFVRSSIVNESEQVDTAIKLTSLLSDQTITELLPYDIDYEQEKERLSEQNAGIKLEDIDG